MSSNKFKVWALIFIYAIHTNYDFHFIFFVLVHFKAIYAIKDRKCVCSISFILENTNEKQDYDKCKRSINYLEKLLKRDLFVKISKESCESKILTIKQF